MKIAPTLQGGLRIDIESILDWARLELIPLDASKNKDNLASSLASQMEMEEDWKDYVLPDIQEGFNEQVHFVYKELKIARSNDYEKGEIHITPENVSLWYGALNQARIALEHEYSISKFMEADSETLEKLDDKIKSAIFKCHFYNVIQQNLLEHVMK